MDFKTFISRLEEVRYVGRLENGYSHIIYEVMYEHVLNATYMLVDVSSMKRWCTNKTTGEKKAINTELLGENLCAVPDFVITNRPDFATLKKEDILKEIRPLGCIEVKFKDVDVKAARLTDIGERKGYLSTYKHVIYTNGWKWSYFNGGEKVLWQVDFNDKEQRNESMYADLLEKLSQIEWEENKNNTPVQTDDFERN